MSRLFFALVFTILPGAALAADLDYSPTEMPSLPQQMVTFGSGWYVRGDLAETDLGRIALGPSNAPSVARQPTNIPVSLYNSRTASYDASLGGGYAFTNNVRVDLTADFFQPSQTMRRGVYCDNAKDSSCATFGSIDRYAVLVNGYYDIGTWSIVTPYVGVGVGVEYASAHAYGDGYTNVTDTRTSSTSFAWALMAGVAIDVYQHVKLDLGYRYLAAPSLLTSRVSNNEIRAGLRYMIDN